MEKYQSFLSENFLFLEMKFSIYLNIFVMRVTVDIFNATICKFITFWEN